MTIIYKPVDINNGEQFKEIKRLIDLDLSEPYSIWVYNYFLTNWSEISFVAIDSDNLNDDKPIGCIICKSDMHRSARMRGYIGMLAVDRKYRKKGIAKLLVNKSIEKMKEIGCDEITLETEVENKIALSLYEKIGFIKMKRMFRYYLNEGDAFKLILPLTEKSSVRSTFLQAPQ
ncbi:hypothetical protein Kpol_1065p35 [Vanderwaltozyma polyspora DSM 70294]|uniref:N-acetyltransferase domain-containing protein n=1 Tax=Vanderwaltozyma polyspora (strain ATCC 22028 / DSM 70294 / BCRC 21397 / CBS 2163 / NBRC 10782 / NRRL Y-8283 / UCD 57-17) TaxID=436907 RepID=A7TL56_VANPO|nr:uncharacterized protein Kpol_1065p35 [Vanderwaltozyma polyspora DSM 70294]EDO17019.1 hypothetical protein Kpol_1065p35 [Vanderwaltozyma polyspora DSM 70294]